MGPCKTCGSFFSCSCDLKARQARQAESLERMRKLDREFTQALFNSYRKSATVHSDTNDLWPVNLRLSSGNRLRLTSDGTTWRMAILPMEHAR
jgi:hypothetical protein